MNTSDSPQALLKRAFLLTSFGLFDDAIQCCQQAAALDESPLSDTLHGAILTASGKPLEAIKHLLPIHRAHPDHLLTSLHLAEACFLAGRHRRGWKILNALSDDELRQSPWADLATSLRDTWESLVDLQPQQPLVVPSH